jgi:hypothetical protein
VCRWCSIGQRRGLDLQEQAFPNFSEVFSFACFDLRKRDEVNLSMQVRGLPEIMAEVAKRT